MHSPSPNAVFCPGKARHPGTLSHYCVLHEDDLGRGQDQDGSDPRNKGGRPNRSKYGRAECVIESYVIDLFGKNLLLRHQNEPADPTLMLPSVGWLDASTSEIFFAASLLWSPFSP